MKCSEVMTRDPVCCVPTDSVAHIAALMRSENIGPVPIVENEKSKRLVGIVTDRDLAVQVVAEGRDPSATAVNEIMSRNPVTCRTEDDVQRVVETMAEHQLRRIPVVDKNNQIVGIISQADVATRVNQPDTTAEVVKEISKSNSAN